MPMKKSKNCALAWFAQTMQSDSQSGMQMADSIFVVCIFCVGKALQAYVGEVQWQIFNCSIATFHKMKGHWVFSFFVFWPFERHREKVGAFPALGAMANDSLQTQALMLLQPAFSKVLSTKELLFWHVVIMPPLWLRVWSSALANHSCEPDDHTQRGT